MLTKIKESESARLAITLILVAVIGMLLQWTGLMQKATSVAGAFGMAIVGYESKEYVVSGKNPTPIAMMMGVSIEQEIYLTQDIVEYENIMLEIDVANYERINTGQLVCEIHQGDVVKVFVTDMSQIKENKTLRLISDTEGFKKGDIIINMYAPEATGENCVAVYTLSEVEVYPELIVNGKSINSNACMDLVIPSDFAKSDFVKVN